MEAGKLRHKIEVWGNVEFTNEVNEEDNKSQKIKEIHAEIIPQTGNLMRQQGIETIISRTTHKFIIRYPAGKDLKTDNWFMFRGQRFNISYILNPYFRNEKLEFFCEEFTE